MKKTTGSISGLFSGLYTLLTATDQKQKGHKKLMLTTIKYNNIDIQAMLLQLIFPFYDFCGF